MSALETAVPTRAEEDHRVRNIALTGPYGSGKSSVLYELRKRLRARGMTISLSTLTADYPDGGTALTNEANALSTTNFVQKEIVKQILYREPSGRLPESRFERIQVLPWSANLAIGLSALALWLGIGGLLRLPETTAKAFTAGDVTAAWWMLVFFGIAVGAGSTLLFTIAKKRLQVASFTAGPATITLSNREVYYFDQYLDEIVYFFARSKVQVLIFEDIDRFDNTHVFESLRNLNLLLNGSRDISRPVYFIYAVRDSMFDPAAARPGLKRHVDPTGGRTKFFDLIIPLVPFITHRTARELLAQEMEATLPRVSDGLITLVGPCLNDMRLLRNVHNEYATFAHNIFTKAENPALPGLTPDKLFAMIVVKNIAPTEFERIRTQEGSLDLFFEDIRTRRTAELETLRKQRATISDVELQVTALAKRFGVELERFIRYTVAGASSVRGELQIRHLEIAGNLFAEEDIPSDAFIKAFLQADEVVITFTTGMSITLDEKVLASVLPDAPNYEALTTEAVRARDTELQELDDRYNFVRAASVQDFMAAEDFAFQGGVSPAHVAAQTLASLPPVVTELIRSGAIDQHYVLYTAHYYGKALTASAMTFIIRHVEPNKPNYDYHFDGDTAIRALIESQGLELFDDEAGFSIEIADYVAAHNPAAAQRLASRLQRGDEAARAFLASAMRAGMSTKLWGDVAAGWAESLMFLGEVTGVNEATRAGLLLEAFERMRLPQADRGSAAVSKMLHDHAAELLEASKRTSGARLQEIIKILARHSVRFDSIESVSGELRRLLVKEGCFVMNERNLKDLARLEQLPSLDELLSADTAAYTHAVLQSDAYAKLARTLNVPTIRSKDAMVQVVTDVARSNSGDAHRIIMHAEPTLFLEDLQEVPHSLWSSFYSANRVVNTITNAVAYLDEHNWQVDNAIATTWKQQTIFAGSAPSRIDLRLVSAVINSGRVSPRTKFSLLDSADFSDILDPQDLGAIAFTLIDKLLQRGWLEDDDATLNRAVQLGLPSFVALTAASKNLPTLLPSNVLPSNSLLEAALRSRATPDDTRAAIFELLPRLDLPPKTAQQLIHLATTAKTFIASQVFIEWLLETRGKPSIVLGILERGVERRSIDFINWVLEELGGEFANLVAPSGTAIHFSKVQPGPLLLQTLQRHGNVLAWSASAKQCIVQMRGF